MHAHCLDSRKLMSTDTLRFLFFLKIPQREILANISQLVLHTRGELSSWPPDEDLGKLGHQSSASTRLLGGPYSLSAKAISQLLRCIYTAEGRRYGDMVWWLFDVTCLRPGNRPASVNGCRGMRRLGSRECVCVCMHVCVSSFFSPSSNLQPPTSLSLSFSCSTFFTFMLGWLLPFPCQHSWTLFTPASMHVLLCFWSCSTFSRWKIEQIGEP